MYQINEISNRDVALLYEYRILRQPADFLSAVYKEGESVVCAIQEGSSTDLTTDDGKPIYSYVLDIELVDGKIPYLEFDAATELDRRRLANMLYLDGRMLYSLSSAFEKPVQITIYWVNAISDIQRALGEYSNSLAELNIDKLREAFEERKSQPSGATIVSGRDDNLLKISGKDMVDSNYLITSALDAQLLVNPSQELLMLLPRRLKHNINISITDGKTRYLSSFSGYSISIQGNCDWVLRDIECGINFVDGEGKVYLRNCRLVHFRNATDTPLTTVAYTCTYLHAHRSLIIRNQGIIQDVCLVGGSTLLDVPNPIRSLYPAASIQHVTLIGYGCSLYSWATPIVVDTSAILGVAWWLVPGSKQTALYIAGKRIDEVGGEHDAELPPSQILEYNVDNIHIHQGGE